MVCTRSLVVVRPVVLLPLLLALFASSAPVLAAPHSPPRSVALIQPDKPDAPTLVSVSVGRSHACATTLSGGVMCWGSNENGELGDGTTTYRAAPVFVTGLTSGVNSVAAGDAHSCALLTDGHVKCWGAGNRGQLGNNFNGNSSTPVDVADVTNAVRLTAGGLHTCIVTNTGGARCWGSSEYGQLGNGSGGAFVYSTVPVNVTGLSNGVTAISAGLEHTCAVVNGAVQCWGDNLAGQLGNNSTTPSSTPVPTGVLTSNVTAVSAGSSHTCGIKSGAAYCWGYNGFSQLGDGTNTLRKTPVQVSGLTSNVIGISAATNHTCAVVNNGARCWGDNTLGELGDGTFDSHPQSNPVSGLSANVASIAVGGGASGGTSCAVKSDNTIYCWGDNSFGQLGMGQAGKQLYPTAVSGLSANVTAIATGYDHTCAIVSGGARCWGHNINGQLGNGTNTESLVPVSVSTLSSGVTAIDTGLATSCAVVGGAAKCWGYNGYNQLGNGGYADSNTPVNVSTLGSGVTAVAVGTMHACALLVGGTVKCWGYDQEGELGDGVALPGLPQPTPVDVFGLSGVTAIAAGDLHTCALLTDHTVKCWGRNLHGQLGNGTSGLGTNSSTAVPVSLLSGVTAISAGGDHTCAIAGGAAKCWGSNSSGELGIGSWVPGSSNTPAQVMGLTSGVTAITAGVNHSCAIAGGAAKCWGSDTHGELGNGMYYTASPTPVDVVGLSGTVSAIAGGDYSTCAIVGGAVKCWGWNQYGQLGTGELGLSRLPLRVLYSGMSLQYLPLIRK